MYEILKPDFTFQDDRGELVQLVHKGYEQINVLFSRKGTLRGGHYHKESREAFFVVSGCVELCLEQENGRETNVFQKGDFFLIQSYEIHSMSFPEDCTLVAMYDKRIEHEDGTKDIYSK